MPNIRFDTDRQQRRCAPLLAAGQAARWASRAGNVRGVQTDAVDGRQQRRWALRSGRGHVGGSLNNLRMFSGLRPLAALGALCLAACAGVPPVKSPGLDLAHAAEVTGGWWGGAYRGGRVTLESVGAAYRTSKEQTAFLVPPGSSLARVSLSLCTGYFKTCRPLLQVEVSFDAQERHAYRIRATEIVHGGDKFRVWVEDSASGETVGEKQTSDGRTLEPGQWKAVSSAPSLVTTPNQGLEGSAEQRCCSVPSALRAAAPPQPQR